MRARATLIHDSISTADMCSVTLRRGNDYVIRRSPESFPIDTLSLDSLYDRWMGLSLRGEPGYAHFSIPTAPIFDVN